MSTWKWDWQHSVILAAFALGLTWYVLAHLAGQTITVASVLPVGMVALSAVFAFFKNPPSNPKDAFTEGAANTNGSQRGFADVGPLAVVSGIGLAVLAVLISGCLSSAPLVPVTAANQSQVSSCQSTATFHNGVVIGDFVLGGAASGLASAAAAVGDSNTKTTLGVAGAAVGGTLVVGTALAELTASNFTNSKCDSVVGPLPASAGK